MRPVDKPHPTDAAGKPKTFAKYGDAKPDLLRQLGEYCSYCEMHLATGLAVEHVLPKSVKAEYERSWSNFLLGCVHCNSRKQAKVVELEDTFWPDQDNTLRAFEYEPLTNTVSVHSQLKDDDSRRAQTMLDLVGLHNVPAKWNEDPRYDERRNVWKIAMDIKNELWSRPSNEHPKLRQRVVENAVPRGFFSVWMTVFDDDSETRRLLIEAFQGTARDCFDANGAPVKRRGGKL